MKDKRGFILDLRKRERQAREEALLDKVIEVWKCEEILATFRNKLYAPKLMYDEIIKEEEEAKKKKAAEVTFEETGAQIGRLVTEKNKAYGDSFGKSGEVLKILYPNGIKRDQYSDMLVMIRIIDKLFRIATDRDFQGESPFNDIAGYGILKVTEAEKEKS